MFTNVRRTPRDKRTFALAYGEQFLGKPYIYGGKGPIGFDCSGFLVELFKAIGLIGRLEDYTAAGLLMQFRLNVRDVPKPGYVVFFGPSVEHVTHAALVTEVLADGTTLMLEAGGGEPNTKTPEQAEALGAMVRIRPLRKDLVAIVDPFAE